MIFSLLIFTIASNAVTTHKDKSILYSRSGMQALAIVIYITYLNINMYTLEKAIGIYNNLFTVTIYTQYFNIFIVLLSGVIGLLNAFYPRVISKSNNDIDTDIEEHKVTTSQVFREFTINKELSNNTESKMSKELTINEEFNNTEGEEPKELTINEKFSNTEGKVSKEFIVNKESSPYNIIEYFLITVFIISGAVLLMSTGDLISLFLSIELQSYGLYILASIYRESESATNSGLTYFLLGGLSSCFILLASAILYANSGTTDLENLYIINSINELTDFTLKVYENSKLSAIFWGEIYTSDYINFSLIILTVGFFFKISAAPFHFWSPDVYDGIPTIVTTFIAIIAKISIFILLLELVSYLDITLNLDVNDSYSKPLTWKNIIILSSLMSLIIGSVLGLSQHRIKRLLAYSTISHVGFIILALSVNNIESIQAYIFYILQYSLSNLNTFFIIIVIGYTLYTYKYNLVYKDNDTKNVNDNEHKFIDSINSPIQLLSQLKGYFYINSFLSISLAITLFSFVGIPPLIGFFAKQMVLSAALNKGYIFVVFIGIITSVIGAVYYLNIIKLLFFSKSDYSQVNNLDSGINNPSNTYVNSMLSMVITILTMITLLFIFTPDEWLRITNVLSVCI